MLSKVAILCLVATCVFGQYVEDLRPKPFSYNYEVTDEDGNVQGHSSTQDASGRVVGTMLIRLINGLYRNARYEADGGGFRIFLQSNEPGMGSDSPASSTFDISPPPAGIYDSKYITRRKFFYA